MQLLSLILVSLLFVGMLVYYLVKKTKAETYISLACVIIFSYFTWVCWKAEHEQKDMTKEMEYEMVTLDTLLESSDSVFYIIHDNDTFVISK